VTFNPSSAVEEIGRWVREEKPGIKIPIGIMELFLLLNQR
jgi:hypothetical protein